MQPHLIKSITEDSNLEHQSRIDFKKVRDICEFHASMLKSIYKWDVPPYIAVKQIRDLSMISWIEGLKTQGTEWLGSYLTDRTNRIELNTDCIHACAEGLHCNPCFVRDVVLVHELAHSVQHLSNGLVTASAWTWSSGLRCDTAPLESENGGVWNHEKHVEFVEKMAQSATYICLREHRDDAILNVFEQMAERSPPQYQDWIADPAELRSEFDEGAKRMKRFHMFETDPRCLKLKQTGIGEDDIERIMNITRS